ncbi:SulP family sulfate permease [Evansella vedderi]|uniref:SulP family sulfate permease n=1 Tax=Evansella vedderi TaxID=38282 RepID=A0ABT9ZNN5_9BACI|nr:sulfate permease [Evansella vedderi]MDQ0252853.1 SulP family sulfate permease [Evansella vedderi]
MLNRILPAANWIKDYQRRDLYDDLNAGIIVFIMYVPQGMAYAMLAGLPPVMGLYAATIPVIIYTLFASSKHLAVGPVALISLLVLSGVSTIAEPGSPEYVSYVLLLSFMIGVIHFLLGILKMGVLLNFLSHAVISGFISAAAIIIAFSQLKNVLGIDLQSSMYFYLVAFEAAQNINNTNLYTLSLALGSIFALVILKKYFPKFPTSIIVVVVSMLTVYWFNLDQQGVKIVGSVPSGLPGFSAPVFTLESIRLLLPTALTIAFIAFMESVAIAKSIAAKENYRIYVNQELKGIGLANIIGSFFSSYPITGSFTRSAVNYQSGAKTPLASIFTVVFLIITLLFFTQFFYYLPHATLSAIILVAVYKLVDFKEAKHLFKMKKTDGWMLVVTFISTLIIGLELGILVGIIFSLITVLHRTANPDPFIVELGYIEQKDAFQNIHRIPNGKTYSGTVILRIDSSLYFANISHFEKKLEEVIQQRTNIKSIIFDMSGVNSIDSEAVHRFEEILKDLSDKKGIQFEFTHMKYSVREIVTKSQWDTKFGLTISHQSLKAVLTRQGLMKNTG